VCDAGECSCTVGGRKGNKDKTGAVTIGVCASSIFWEGCGLVRVEGKIGESKEQGIFSSDGPEVIGGETVSEMIDGKVCVDVDKLKDELGD